MICLIALVVFGVLAIFSAKHRPLAREALDCVLRRITFRPCVANLDQKLKGQTAGWLLEHAPWLAKPVYKNFEFISWVFTFLLFLSIAGSLWGFYNWWAYGNCNGPEQTGFCVFNAVAKGEGLNWGSLLGLKPALTRPEGKAGWLIGSPDAELTVIEFGCYSCPYTKQAEPVVKQLLEHYQGRVNVLFKVFPIPAHPYAKEMALAAEAAGMQGKWLEMHEKLFERQDFARLNGEKEIKAIAGSLGLDLERFERDFKSAQAFERVVATSAEGEKAGIYGTPTFFIGEKTVVGPKEFEEMRALIDGELGK
ncbi:MAG TPA: thioredoxin domain-containing protein [Candidatus Diapherotrites archaeon]|uniref:Thioredoxin domain-containing protein n=1 Tax=Candidatus Iainarchaeum sp. TaxID=3101447 RepID=A0A7J4JG62_9ARCH|nr:thioredoxin domain-containing protein [Candidatus Diapherotrites archaeon]HIH16742.1 thioredoxin domain-containing protein [Candidatus Diapherotrites archaeon]